MIEPVDGKVIYPYDDRTWVRVINNEVQLFRMTEHTCIFLDVIESLHKSTGMELVNVQVHSVYFPELFFEDYKYGGYARVFYEDHCWNIHTEQLHLNSKMMREAVVPFLEFLDKHAIKVDYKLVKEYLGLEEQVNSNCEKQEGTYNMNKEIERCVNCKLKDKCPLKNEIDKNEKDKKNE